MKIIIFGASGQTGKLAVEKALNKGYEVTAYVRDSGKLQLNHEKLTILQGEVTNQENVEKAIANHDVVISCLGSNTGLSKTTILYEMTKTIVDAMKAVNVSRIIYMASAGIEKEIPGLTGKFTMKLLGNVLEDHRNAVNYIKDNELTFTILRPMGLTNKPATGNFREALTGVPGGSRTISREDVADFILKVLINEEYQNKSVALAD